MGVELEYAAELLNRVIEGVSGPRLGIHICRGNWSTREDVLLTGDYAPLLPALRKMKVDQFVLEYATPRAGELKVVGQALSGAVPGEARLRELGLGVVNPRILVAGLNPHAGEGGHLGREEIEVIDPAVADLRLSGTADFSGPYPPDTVFHRAARGDFDAVLCMYHDQGLIPLKLHAFDEGVNVTLGLPFVRTSPDHGTAFDIAGKGVARPDSMIAAIRLAARMIGESGGEDSRGGF